MLQNKRIAILGAGSMAKALVAGLLRNPGVSVKNIVATHYKQEKAEKFSAELGVRVVLDNREAVKGSDIVILAVKPQALPGVLKEIASSVSKQHLVISIAAGVTTSFIKERLPKAILLRTMPNLPATIGEGVTAICGSDHSKDTQVDIAKAIFACVGKVVLLDEDQLDAVTGLSGSGPAFVFLIIDALADAGVKVGLSRDVSLMLASQTVLGASKLLVDSGEHPGKLKDQVTSPGGTAIAGIHTLEQGGLRTTLINAVESATNRSRELGLKFSVKK